MIYASFNIHQRSLILQQILTNTSVQNWSGVQRIRDFGISELNRTFISHSVNPRVQSLLHKPRWKLCKSKKQTKRKQHFLFVCFLVQQDNFKYKVTWAKKTCIKPVKPKQKKKKIPTCIREVGRTLLSLAQILLAMQSGWERDSVSHPENSPYLRMYGPPKLDLVSLNNKTKGRKGDNTSWVSKKKVNLRRVVGK